MASLSLPNVRAGKNRVELCRTVWYTRWRHSLPDRDRFESQQLIRRPSREEGTSVIPREGGGVNDTLLPTRVTNENARN